MISFRIDWMDLLAVQGPFKSSLAQQLEAINFSMLSPFYGPNLTSLRDYWKNHSFNYIAFCQQSDVSAF